MYKSSLVRAPSGARSYAPRAFIGKLHLVPRWENSGWVILPRALLECQHVFLPFLQTRKSTAEESMREKFRFREYLSFSAEDSTRNKGEEQTLVSLDRKSRLLGLVLNIISLRTFKSR